MLCQLARQELVKLSVEDTISHKLRAGARVSCASGKRTQQVDCAGHKMAAKPMTA